MTTDDLHGITDPEGNRIEVMATAGQVKTSNNTGLPTAGPIYVSDSGGTSDFAWRQHVSGERSLWAIQHLESGFIFATHIPPDVTTLLPVKNSSV